MFALFGILMIGIGVMFLMHGRTLPTWKEEEEAGRDDSFLYELLQGPPGFNRSRAIGGGIGLIGGGILVVLGSLFNH